MPLGRPNLITARAGVEGIQLAIPQPVVVARGDRQDGGCMEQVGRESANLTKTSLLMAQL